MQAQQQIQDLALRDRIQRRGGLVADQHRRIKQQRPGNRQPLQLASRALARVPVQQVGVQFNIPDGLCGCAPGARPPCSSGGRSSGASRLARSVMRGSKASCGSWKTSCTSVPDTASSPPSCCVPRGQCPGDAAAVRGLNLHEQPGQGALPGAGLAQDAKNLALPQAERNTLQCRPGATPVGANRLVTPSSARMCACGGLGCRGPADRDADRSPERRPRHRGMPRNADRNPQRHARRRTSRRRGPQQGLHRRRTGPSAGASPPGPVRP